MFLSKLISSLIFSILLVKAAPRNDFPCPEAADIQPCICSLNEYNHLSLDCTNVETSQELGHVFKQDFPNKHFKYFYMEYNDNITVLGDVFNGVMFENVTFIRNHNIASISQYFLYDSLDVIEYIAVTYTKLTTNGFPFASLSSYEKLYTLILSYAEFSWIPKIQSDSLSLLALESANINELPIDTFDYARNLSYINLGGNNIKSIAAETFNLINDKLNTIYLYENDLQTIEPGAFQSNFDTYATLELHLQGNQLTTIDEEVFYEFFYHDRIQLTIFGNPLECGCDIAWLIKGSFMSQIDSLATCADGTNLHELNPGLYADCDLKRPIEEYRVKRSSSEKKA